MTDTLWTSPDDVFINCPFDARYRPIFEALVFAIFVCEFRPRSALELDDASVPRIEKLYAIVEAFNYPYFASDSMLGVFKKYLNHKNRL